MIITHLLHNMAFKLQFNMIINVDDTYLYIQKVYIFKLTIISNE